MLAQIAIALLSAGAAITAIAPDPNTETKYLFVFGDSFTFTNFSIDGAKPSPSNPMGNPPPPGDTFCGGLAWPGYLATEFNTSVTLTFNFASPGSTVDAAIVPPWKSDRLSLVDQFNNWAKSMQSKPAYAPWRPENALFATWIGINDLFNTFLEPEDQAAVVNRVLDGYFARLGTLYAQGARHFALLNVPPIDRTPAVINNLGVTKITNLANSVQNWNSQLPVRAGEFMAANSGAKVTIVDTHSA